MCSNILPRDFNDKKTQEHHVGRQARDAAARHRALRRLDTEFLFCESFRW